MPETDILILTGNPDLAGIWQRQLVRRGYQVAVRSRAEEALAFMELSPPRLLVLGLGDDDPAGALVVADIAVFRNPDVTIIPINNGRLFADGSVYEIIPNVRGMLSEPVNIFDLESMIDHCLAAEDAMRIGFNKSQSIA